MDIVKYVSGAWLSLRDRIAVMVVLRPKKSHLELIRGDVKSALDSDGQWHDRLFDAPEEKQYASMPTWMTGNSPTSGKRIYTQLGICLALENDYALSALRQLWTSPVELGGWHPPVNCDAEDDIVRELRNEAVPYARRELERRWAWVLIRLRRAMSRTIAILGLMFMAFQIMAVLGFWKAPEWIQATAMAAVVVVYLVYFAYGLWRSLCGRAPNLDGMEKVVDARIAEHVLQCHRSPEATLHCRRSP